MPDARGGSGRGRRRRREPPSWYPSRREQAWDWRLRRVMRYVVGPAVIGWELVVDDGKNLIVLLVGAMLSTSTDMVATVRGMIRQARLEERTVEEMIREDRERERGGR